MSQSSEKERIAILFGAGISIPAGMPSTQSITEKVLSGENIMHHTGGNYYFRKPQYHHMGLPDEYVPGILYFMKRLKIEIDLYYSKYPFKHNTNYEDIYFLATQIYDTLKGEYDNPAVLLFVDKVKTDIKTLLTGKSHETRKIWELDELAEETTKYISDIVCNMLDKPIESSKHLDLLESCYLDDENSKIDIYTLNHDKVIEEYLNSKSIEFNDGFNKYSPRIRRWEPRLLDMNKTKVRLFKLHGSIDWFRFRPEDSDWSEEFIGIPNKMDIFHIEDSEGRRLWGLDHRPPILLGTYNKMLDYTGGINEDIFYHFYKSFRKVKDLIICGYSFGDRGINTKIINWIYLSPINKIIVIHPEPDKLKAGSRGSIGNKWDGWLQQDKLNLVPKGIEDTSWDELKRLLNNRN